MKLRFHGGLLVETDYFGSLDWSRGQAWLGVHGTSWHVLLPDVPRSMNCAQVYPFPAEDEPEGWAWCVDVDGRRWMVPSGCIHGERPAPPVKGHAWRRAAVIYTGQTQAANRAAFGGTHDLRDGLNGHSCRLWVTCGFRVAPAQAR